MCRDPFFEQKINIKMLSWGFNSQLYLCLSALTAHRAKGLTTASPGLRLRNLDAFILS